jgi:uncharacterized protein (TIGR00369 family)
MSVSTGLGRLVPFAEHLGIRVTHQEPGRAILEMDVRPEMLNSWLVAHGGAVMTLADIALAVAARTLDTTAKGAMTVELKVSFISPGRGKLIAEGRCIHSGTSLAFCEGEVRNQAGKLVAKAVGTFMLRRGRDVGDDAMGAAPAE